MKSIYHKLLFPLLSLAVAVMAAGCGNHDADSDDGYDDEQSLVIGSTGVKPADTLHSRGCAGTYMACHFPRTE